MHALARPALETGEPNPLADQRVALHGVAWWHYEALLAIRGDRAVPRITYLKGTLELMSPSRSHETVKELLGRLIEAYGDAAGIPLYSTGSWTIRDADADLGAEPDKSYSLEARLDRPDLAIEVAWTRGGIDKLDVYAGLGVPEVWLWRDGKIEVFGLRGGRYRTVRRSKYLPGADLELLARLALCSDQPEAVRVLREAIRAGAKASPRRKRARR